MVLGSTPKKLTHQQILEEREERRWLLEAREKFTLTPILNERWNEFLDVLVTHDTSAEFQTYNDSDEMIQEMIRETTDVLEKESDDLTRLSLTYFLFRIMGGDVQISQSAQSVDDARRAAPCRLQRRLLGMLLNAHSFLKFEQGDMQQALISAVEAVALYPTCKALMNRGNGYAELGLFEESIADYRSAIELKINYPKPYYNKALTLEQMGRLVEALQDARQAYLLDQEDEEYYDNFGRIRSRLLFKSAISSDLFPLDT